MQLVYNSRTIVYNVQPALPVALLSSDACELAPLRIVLLCVFLPIFFTSLLIRVCLQWLCTTEEHFWTLDIATLTWLRILYPRTQRGHWRYFGAPSWTMTTWTTAGGEGNTVGDVLEYAADWGKGHTALLCRVFCSLMSNPWRINGRS